MQPALFMSFATLATARHLINMESIMAAMANTTSNSTLSAAAITPTSAAASTIPTVTPVTVSTSRPAPVETKPAAQSTVSSQKAAATSQAAAPAANQKVQFGGMNIAGLDFGCDIQSNCNLGSALDPVSKTNGIEQMNHFIKDSGLNTLRMPVSWQFLANNKVGGSLDSTNPATYDKLMQGCLSSGSTLCVIDVHNYGRFQGKIIGQGGPSNDDFAGLWTQLATKYAKETKVAFGLMNEPHDLDINVWAGTVQAAVTAIRNAGANQMILMPGNNFTSAGAFIENGSADALSKVTNPDGTTTNLVFDVHKYLDQDNSGTHTECTTNNIDTAFSPLATYLRENKRTAFVTETGAGNTDSCFKAMCEQLAFLNQNADVYLGWIGWGAGGFDGSYELTETPIKSGNTLTDRPIVSQCIAGQFKSNTSR